MARHEFGNAPIVAVGSQMTNPTTGLTMADSGALPRGPRICQVTVIVGASVAAVVSVEHRNAANDANIEAPVIYLAAGQSGQYVFRLNMAASERVRVVPVANIVGTAAATVIVEPLA